MELTGLSVSNVVADNGDCGISNAELLAGPRAFVVSLVSSQPQDLSKLHTPQ